MDNSGQTNGGSVARTGTGSGTESPRRGRRTEAERSRDLSDVLPRGITIGRWADGREKGFFVRFGPRHARRLESYTTEKERNDAAERLAEKREQHGAAVLDFDPAEWRRYRDFRTRCAAPLAELETVWARHEARTRTMAIKVAVPRYLGLRLAEDMRRGTDTYRHVDLHLRRLVSRFGLLRLDELTADLLRAALAEIVSDKTGKPIGQLARRHHRKDWNAFFKRCVDEGWLEKNPCSAVKPPKVEARKRKILTPEQAFALFKANASDPVVGRLALEAFGALRAASAERLRELHLRWAEHAIELDKEEGDQADIAHKSGERVWRQGHPPVLWRWLEVSPKEGWSRINRNNYGHRKSAAFLRAGVTNTGNVLRHSCISYLLVLTKSYEYVGYLAQHTDRATTMLYEGAATETDARLYLALTPDAVKLSWPRFLKQWRRFYREPPVPRT